MNRSTKSFIFKLSIISFSFLLLCSCNSRSKLMKPDFNRYSSIKSRGVKVVDVVDERKIKKRRRKTLGKVDPHQVGYVLDGELDMRVPYKLDIPLNQFVKNSMNKILYKGEEKFNPITIFIEEMEVEERVGLLYKNGTFNSRLAFKFSDRNDSLITEKFTTEQLFDGLEISEQIPQLVYKGVNDLALQFIKKYAYHMDGVFKEEEFEETVQDDSTYFEDGGATQDKLLSEGNNNLNKRNFIGLTSYSGDLVTFGVNISYQSFIKSSFEKFEPSYGYGVTFYKIDNKDDDLKGTFISFGSPLSFRYYFADPESMGLYLTGSLRLVIGSESIDYGYHTEYNVFFGPTFEERIGVKFNENFQLELGIYQIINIGSDLLPEDFGLNATLTIGLFE